MKHRFLMLAVLCGLLASPASAQQSYTVPVEYHKLENGLKVVLGTDHTSPTVVVAVYFNIGFRIEPKGRTGFAHLFEHMMFQGSENLGKMEFIRLVQKNGGLMNGSTRFDFTNYFEVVPAHKLETILWAEADRMKGLAITQENLTNQQGVVKNEVKVNVLNQPYGGFPWLDLPQYANTNWHNAHNFYGDLAELDSANLTDVQNFFNTYYAPNNAALVLYGDIDTKEALALVKKYFSGLKPSVVPPIPDLSEPRQEKEKRFTKKDTLAFRPAIAFGYHVPTRNTPEYYAMGILDQILLQGDDGKLAQQLVKKKGYTANVGGGINLLGNMFNYNGPMLWIGNLIHDNTVKADEIVAAWDEVIEEARTKQYDKATIDRAMIKLRSDLYDNFSGLFGFGTADMLASFALFDDDPSRINSLEDEFKKVTPELLQRTAQEYLRPTNRTILIVEPKSSK